MLEKLHDRSANSMLQSPGHPWKTFVSKQIWRIRKSSSIINIGFFCLTLVGIYMSYIPQSFPISRSVLSFILTLLAFIVVLTLGWIYDVFLRLWREDVIADTMRNPYQLQKFSHKELIMMEIDLSQFEATYESMRTNGLICNHYGIPCEMLIKRLADVRHANDTFAKWIQDGIVKDAL